MNKIATLSAVLLFASPVRARVRRRRPAPRSRADPPPRRRVAAARRAQLRQLLPELPQREVHALRAADGHRPHRAADQGQPDVRDRQDRLDDDGRDDAGRGQGMVRRECRPTCRSRRACAAATGSTTISSGSTATTRRPPAGTTSCFPNVGDAPRAVAAVGSEQVGGNGVRESREGARRHHRDQGARQARAGRRRQVDRANGQPIRMPPGR